MHTALHQSSLFREALGPRLRPGGRELTDRGVELCRLPPGAAVLDVGCGSGATVAHLRDRHGHRARGIDISRELIAEGLARDPGLELELGAAESLPVADASQDALFCECVLSLLNAPVRALEEFHRVLRPGGKLVISDLYLHRPSREDRPPAGQGIATSGEIQGWLVAAGFDGIMLWEDHSRALVELAAQVMLTHGSLECLAGLCDYREGKPGYYLLVTGRQ